MSWFRRVFPWALLWFGFFAFGLWIRSVIPWFNDVKGLVKSAGCCGAIEYNGYDYTRYGQMLSDFRMIFYAAFRHPFYGIIMSPVIVVASRLHELGEWPMWCWFVAVFSSVMTGATRMVVKLAGTPVAGVLFASFASTWVLAATPESFGISCLIALVVLWWAQRPKGSVSAAVWCMLAAVAGGITSTQAVKVAIAFLLTNRVTKRIALTVGALLAGAGLVVVAYFVFRVLLRGGDFVESLHNVTDYLVGGGKDMSQRVGEVWIFFSEPIVTRGEPLSNNILSWRYADPIRPLLAALVLIFAGVSAWFARHELLAKLLGGMFLIDMMLHFVLFWGMDEAHIYAGHWIYAIPLLVALALAKMSPSRRHLATLMTYVLAVAVFASNILAWSNISF